MDPIINILKSVHSSSCSNPQRAQCFASAGELPSFVMLTPTNSALAWKHLVFRGCIVIRWCHRMSTMQMTHINKTNALCAKRMMSSTITADPGLGSVLRGLCHMGSKGSLVLSFGKGSAV